MKFKIEVELDWIGEEGSLDDEIQKSIVHQVVQAVSEEITKNVQTEATAIIGPKVDELVEKTYNDLVNSKVVIVTDRWGDKNREYENMRDLIKAKWDGFLGEKVDSQGRPTTSYNNSDAKTRVEHLVNEQLTKFSQEWTKRVLVEITDNIKSTLSADLRAALGERVMDLIDIKSLVAAKK